MFVMRGVRMAASQHDHGGAGCARKSSWAWVYVAFGVMAVVLLWQEHRAHLLGVIPYLILFACPLMHLLHRGHHRGHGREEDRHA
jgi:hypothetical protein